MVKQADYNRATGKMRADLKIIGTKAKSIKGSPKLGAYSSEGIRVSQGGKGRTQLGRVSKSYTKKKSGPGDGVNIVAFDEVTPALIDIKYYIKGYAAKQLATELERLIVKNVPDRYYDENRGKWPALSKAWRNHKSRAGLETRKMHMHDNRPDKSDYGMPLSYAVDSFGSNLNVRASGPNSYTISGLDEEFASSPYVWLHEQGFKNQHGGTVPARPFINPGINDSLAGALRVVFERNPTKRKSSGKGVSIGAMTIGPSPMGSPILGARPATATAAGPMTGGSYTWNLSSLSFKPVYKEEKKRMLPLGLIGILWWIMPPVPLLNYLGYAHDLKGYLSGHFLQTSTAASFAKGLMRGQLASSMGVPMSAKMMRRKTRMGLWGK